MSTREGVGRPGSREERPRPADRLIWAGAKDGVAEKVMAGSGQTSRAHPGSEWFSAGTADKRVKGQKDSR